MARNEPPVQLSERVYAITGAVNSAIVAGEGGQAVLVDTGQDSDHGRRLRRALDELGLTPVAILNTHSHADHYGGNDYLVRQYPQAVVHAPPFEAAILRAPYLEPVYLFHGAKPPAEMTTKWLQAKPSPVHVEVESGPLEVAGLRLELLDVRGHAHRMFAVLVDDVLVASDAVFGAATLERYPLPFGQDVGAQKAAHDVVAGSGARVVLPGHGDATEDVAGLVAANAAAVARAEAAVLGACHGTSTEEVLARVGDELGLAMDDLPRYHLNLCTVSAYLSHLRETGRVTARLAAGRLTWAAA
ncbi:MAG TPA: MBL fold metallo-hydrolase [Trueperaceae bacterium]|nr:MBL fold metallo-hydrolase [Trueperaceae bacterium]